MAHDPTADPAAGQPPATPPPAAAPTSATPPQPPTPEEITSADDAVLEASLESFPGSDAPAWIGSRGTP